MPVGKNKILFRLKQLVKMVFIKNYFIAICAGFWYLSSAILINNSLSSSDFAVAAFVFFSTVLMYNLDRLFGDEWPLVRSFILSVFNKNHTFRKAHAKVAIQILFIVPIFILLFYLPIELFGKMLPPVLLAFFYALPIGARGHRIREIPFVKIFVIAFVWAWIGSFWCSYTQPQMVVRLFFERFLFIYAITIPFDLRDVKADIRQSLTTIPLKAGTRLSLLTSLIAIAVMLVLIFTGHGHFLFIRSVAASFALLLVLLWNKKRTWVYYLFFIDGCILLEALVIFAQYYW